MAVPQFIQSVMDIWIFPFLALKKAAVNIRLHVFGGHTQLFLLGLCLEVKILDNRQVPA